MDPILVYVLILFLHINEYHTKKNVWKQIYTIMLCYIIQHDIEI